jgi:hypothetical protein
MAKSRPGTIHLQIVEVMKRFPDGITGGQIRLELGLAISNVSNRILHSDLSLFAITQL